MSKYAIGKVARNNYIVDIIEACEEEAKLNHADFMSIDNAIMILADDTTIDDWEKWFALDKQPTWTLQDRIDRLVYTFNSRGFFTPEFLKSQAKVFTNGEIEIEEYFSEYRFVIQFISSIGTVPNLDNFEKMVRTNMPEHLTFEIKLRYRTHKELKPYTHRELSKYTHAELRSRAILDRMKGEK